MESLVNSDKDLFIGFRDGNMTMDQLKVRQAERLFNITFKCLDDLKERNIIDERFYNNVDKFLPFFNLIYGDKATYKDVARELQPYESNLRCLKSIKYDPRKASAVFN
jgi:hypothetical protein